MADKYYQSVIIVLSCAVIVLFCVLVGAFLELKRLSRRKESPPTSTSAPATNKSSGVREASAHTSTGVQIDLPNTKLGVRTLATSLDIIKMKVTAYCPCEKCCGKWAKIPLKERKLALGYPLMELLYNYQPFVAGPPSMKFGTWVRIPGYNNGLPVPVLDRGGAIKEGCIDVFFPLHELALEWGVQELDVIIERKEK